MISVPVHVRMYVCTYVYMYTVPIFRHTINSELLNMRMYTYSLVTQVCPSSCNVYPGKHKQ